MSTESITLQLRALPDKPGVYLFRDAKEQLLYVGKAKVLKHRVRSYFQPGAALEPAKAQMLPKIVNIETISCDTENEALILEANLIRKHQPPYNVVLTDDKYYLFIKVTKEAMPRVYPVRRITVGDGRYFGPFSSASSVRRTLKLLRRLFPHFGESTKEKTWFFPHPLFAPEAKNSLPASPRHSDVGQPPVDSEHYTENIVNVISFLEGKRDKIMARLKDGMKAASQEKAYERAALFRDQLQAIEKLEGSQKVYLPTKESFDVVSIVTRGTQSAANVFSVRDGKLLQKNTFLLKHRSSALIEDVLRQFMLQYYAVAQDIPAVILIPCPLPDQAAIAYWINHATPPILLVPQRGKKRQLLAMGELNAQQLLTSEEINFSSDQRLERAVGELFSVIGISSHFAPDGATRDNSPVRIETYDVSNIQGKLATGSMVVFIDGKPSKQHYKKFRIQLPDTPNDFAMMQEVLGRRFSNRHVGEQGGWPMPDLIMIDGGKGQLSAAMRVLDELQITVPVISLAKREEEIFICPTPTDGQQGKGRQFKIIRLPFDSDALYLVQRMRDEAHRFTITYHRLLRSKRASQSLLDEIPGIGPTLKKRLLARFGSLKNIRAATDDELAAVLGSSKTKVLRDYL